MQTRMFELLPLTMPSFRETNSAHSEPMLTHSMLIVSSS